MAVLTSDIDILGYIVGVLVRSTLYIILSLIFLAFSLAVTYLIMLYIRKRTEKEADKFGIKKTVFGKDIYDVYSILIAFYLWSYIMVEFFRSLNATVALSLASIAKWVFEVLIKAVTVVYIADNIVLFIDKKLKEVNIPFEKQIVDAASLIIYLAAFVVIVSSLGIKEVEIIVSFVNILFWAVAICIGVGLGVALGYLLINLYIEDIIEKYRKKK